MLPFALRAALVERSTLNRLVAGSPHVVVFCYDLSGNGHWECESRRCRHICLPFVVAREMFSANGVSVTLKLPKL